MKETIIEVRPIRSQPVRRGIPLWVAVLALLVLAGFSIGVLGYFLRRANNDRARMERRLASWEQEKQKAELDRQKAVEQVKAVVAGARQSDALALTRTAKDACEQLLINVRKLKQEALALRTSADGRLVAQYPDLVALARRLYDYNLKELARETAVISKLEGERRIEAQLINTAGTSFLPDSSLTGAVQADTLWLAREAGKVDRARALVASLIVESRIKVPPSGVVPRAQTLDRAMAAMAEEEAVAREKTILDQTAQATASANETTAAAETERILSEAKLKAAMVKVVSDGAVDEARKVQLRAKAQSPEIQAKLAPFITPGRFQISGMSYEKLPLSYRALMQSGALLQSEVGLTKLTKIAYTRADKDRPRWHFHYDVATGWKNQPAEREMVMEAQQLLIELGPVLVEMKLLQE